MKARQIRQGDVLLEACGRSEIKGLKKTRPTVALGEATGHHHSFEGKHTTGFFKAGDAEVGAQPMAGGAIAGGGGAAAALATHIEVKGKPDFLTHQEHGPIEHPPGIYKKTQQVEYEREQIRNVAD